MQRLVLGRPFARSPWWMAPRSVLTPRSFTTKSRLTTSPWAKSSCVSWCVNGLTRRSSRKGSKGLNINYAQMEFNEENVNVLLELAGARRSASKGGKELAQKFTEEVARDQLLQEVALQGGNVEEIARGLSKDAGCCIQAAAADGANHEDASRQRPALRRHAGRLSRSDLSRLA